MLLSGLIEVDINNCGGVNGSVPADTVIDEKGQQQLHLYASGDDEKRKSSSGFAGRGRRGPTLMGSAVTRKASNRASRFARLR